MFFNNLGRTDVSAICLPSHCAVKDDGALENHAERQIVGRQAVLKGGMFSRFPAG